MYRVGSENLGDINSSGTSRRDDRETIAGLRKKNCKEDKKLSMLSRRAHLRTLILGCRGGRGDAFTLARRDPAAKTVELITRQVV